MQQTIRLRLDMGGRVAEFCRTHADQDPGTLPVVTRLTELLGRAGALTLQQRSGVTIVAAAVSQKTELRLGIENDLGALFGVARSAAKAHPDIAVHRRLPKPRSNENSLLTMARVAVAEATVVKERLIEYGLREGLLEGLTARLDLYEVEMARQRNALAAQVGASADLKQVTIDLMAVVKNLDAIHKVRFARDPELKAAWKSARNVAWRRPELVVPDTPTTPTTPNTPVTPAPASGQANAA